MVAINAKKTLKLLNLGDPLNVIPKAEVKSAEIFTETHLLGVKIDTEHTGAIIFKPKSSKTYEFSQFLNKTTFFDIYRRFLAL